MLRDISEMPAAAPSNPITAPISAGKPDEDDIISSLAGAESLTLSELCSRLECKSSLPRVAECLENLSIFEEWRRTKRPSNQARDAMLKVATQCGVARKKEGQIRKAEDVAEDLEVRILLQGRTLLRDPHVNQASDPHVKARTTARITGGNSVGGCMEC